MTSLKGKVAIITGSSRGIGRATALAFAREGASVVVNDIFEDKKADDVVLEIKQMGVSSLRMQANVTHPDEVQQMVDCVLKEFSRIDILVNNAGIVRDSTLLNMNLSDWDEVIETNLTGVYYCTKAVLNTMMKQKGGNIINISSIVGQIGSFGQANYAASKAGVIGFTKSLAKELANKGIRVNAIAPGYVETDMTKNIPQDIKKQLLEQIPMKRLGKPEEIAEIVVFLASDASSYMTGQTVNVNGGLL